MPTNPRGRGALVVLMEGDCPTAIYLGMLGQCSDRTAKTAHPKTAPKNGAKRQGTHFDEDDGSSDVSGGVVALYPKDDS